VSVKVTIPFHLGHYTGGIFEVEVPGSTVGEVLHNTVKRFPRLGDVLFPHDGRLDEFIIIKLNERVLLPQDNPLKCQVRPGDEISIIFPIGGG
jgi:hypothetical protein